MYIVVKTIEPHQVFIFLYIYFERKVGHSQIKTLKVTNFLIERESCKQFYVLSCTFTTRVHSIK